METQVFIPTSDDAWSILREVGRANLRAEAMQWQAEFDNHSYSWEEIASKTVYFEALAAFYGLTDEFRENGII